MCTGFTNSGWGLGDKVVYTSLPENYYRNTGEKLIDIDSAWEYDYNPFVLRGVTPQKKIDLWHLPLPGAGYPSLAQRICSAFDFPLTPLRHARLYAFEDLTIDANSVTVHVSGNTAPPLPLHVIHHIAAAYSGYKIFQVGALKDAPTPFIDCRGTPVWDTVRRIATCGTFIGIDSGLMNIANCYPRLRRKVVLTYEFGNAIPVSHPIRWIDYGWEYYNITDDDIGISMSYRKL
jgi:hypothetical protein